MSPDLQHEVDRRRTFAIISHPDAGKTTLTEKLLLYGGAIQSAGSVKAKEGRGQSHATSDWMELEKKRGHLDHVAPRCSSNTTATASTCSTPRVTRTSPRTPTGRSSRPTAR